MPSLEILVIIEMNKLNKPVELSVNDSEKPTNSLPQGEERFKNLFEKPKAIMLLIDPISGRIEDANNAAADSTGTPTASTGDEDTGY